MLGYARLDEDLLLSSTDRVGYELLHTHTSKKCAGGLVHKAFEALDQFRASSET
jgi:hypothetical protein